MPIALNRRCAFFILEVWRFADILVITVKICLKAVPFEGPIGFLKLLKSMTTIDS